MKLLNRVTFLLIILSLAGFILASNIRFAVNSMSVYEYCIHNYNISQVTGIDDTQLEKVYQHWIDFYSSKADSPQISVTNKQGQTIEILTPDEVIHMTDVKKLMVLDDNVQIISLIILILSIGFLIYKGGKNKWELLLSGLFFGCVVIFGLIALLAIAFLFNFDQMFVLFHLVSFSNSFWLLPANSYLLMMFPEAFFNFIFIFVFGIIILESVILGGAAFAVRAWLRRKNNISDPDILSTSASAT
jgi:integral membrane protein (TIGR01906 family)